MGPLQEGQQSLLKMTPLTLNALDHVTHQPTTRDSSALKPTLRYTNPLPERATPGSDLLDL